MFKNKQQRYQKPSGCFSSIKTIYLFIYWTFSLNVILFSYLLPESQRSSRGRRAIAQPHTQPPQDKRPHSKNKSSVYSCLFSIWPQSKSCIGAPHLTPPHPQAQSLASSLSTRQLLRICRRLSEHPEESVARSVNKACLSRSTSKTHAPKCTMPPFRYSPVVR